MKGFLETYELLEKIRDNGTTALYQARDRRDNRMVLVKTPGRNRNTPGQKFRTYREFTLLGGLAGIPGIASPREVVEDPLGDVLVLEFFGGQALETVARNGNLDVLTLVSLAISLGEILDQIHKRNLIIKELTPGGILFQPSTGEVLLADLGQTSAVSRESGDQFVPVYAGAPAFLSPEQTGRANRKVDYRSDYYALGMVLYWAATGNLAFGTTDLVEMVHCHLARVPEEPHVCGVPRVLSDIIVKLIAKSPDDRYQSMAGLLADLFRFKEDWSKTGASVSFTLGTQDSKDKFAVSQKPYGRDLEIQRLRVAFGRASRGSKELILVTGDPGIGKTTVVKELYEPLTASRSFLLRGKFDQGHRDTPYHAVVEALEDGIAQVLAGSPEQVAVFRRRLFEDLKTNAAVIVAFAAGFQALLGTQPAPVSLSPKETESRLFLSLTLVLRAFAGADHPVLLFLDDSQWADQASVKLLEHLWFHTDFSHLLAVFSYRDSEVLDSTPFRLFLDRLPGENQEHQIHLGALDREALGRLAADTFQCSPEKSVEWAAILLSKTRGNPFFAGQFLASCHGEGLVAYDLRTQKWTWDPAKIRALDLSGDVLELLASSIRKLPDEAVRCLKFASCLGSRFTLNDLAPLTVGGDYPGDPLLVLLEKEYLVPLDDDYVFLRHPGQALGAVNPEFRFQHDRIRQAAYEMLDENSRQEIHLKIARSGPVNLIDLVSHYNQAIALVTDRTEQELLVRLDFQAADRARASSMFDLAYRLLETSRTLLVADQTLGDLDLRRQVLFAYAEAAYTVQKFTEAEAACTRLQSLLTSAYDRARVLRLQADFYNFLSKIPESLEKSRDALAALGISIPLEPSGEVLYGQILAVGALVAAQTPDEIYALPELTDENLKLALGILAGFIVPAFMSGNQNLFALASLTAVKLSLENGHCAESAIAFGNYGILLSGMGQYQAALGVSELAIRLNERFQDLKWKAFIHSNHTLFTLPWTKPWADFVDHSRQTIDFGFQTGDLFIMAYQCTYIVAWDETLTLAEAVRSQEKYLGIIRETGQDGAWACGKFATQLWKSLAGQLQNRGSFDEPGFGSAPFVRALADQKNYSALAIYHLYSMENYWYFGMYSEALGASRQTDTLVAALTGSALMAEYCLFTFLICASNLGLAPEAERPGLLDRMAKEKERMDAWARSCPGNFSALAAFLGAEVARYKGDFTGARDGYRTAFVLLEPSPNRAHKAIVHEQASTFHRDHGGEKIAGYLLQEAWVWYGRWGASGKQRQLEDSYPRIGFGAPAADSPGVGIDELVDAAALVKATQVISGEIGLEALYHRVIPIVLENAGARACWLVMYSRSGGKVVASGTSDGQISVSVEGTDLEDTPVPRSVRGLLASGDHSILSDHAAADPRLAGDPEVRTRNLRSVLAVSLLSRGEPIGFWYLENDLLDGAFTPGKRETLRALSTQVAISLDNARMYRELEELNHSLERRVVQRTEELAEKNRQILGSIEYAALLQRSILPDPRTLARSLPRHFVLWKPRDLVGGDLYWFQEMPFGFYLAVVDCTGHGVPGAFMTMAAHSNLNQCALDADPSDPAGFLSALHRLTRRALGQNRTEPEADDGFDIGFCSYTAFDDTLHFAGGRIDLVVASPGTQTLIRGDRTSLGYQSVPEDRILTNHKIALASGLTFYMTSDGLASQLGGEKLLPFGRERLLSVLGGLGGMDFPTQAQAVENALARYQADFDQIDDITMVGFQVSQVRDR